MLKHDPCGTDLCVNHAVVQQAVESVAHKRRRSDPLGSRAVRSCFLSGFRSLYPQDIEAGSQPAVAPLKGLHTKHSSS